MDFKKFQIFAQNPYVLAYGSSKSRLFAEKTDQNSIFPGCDPHIKDQQYIMALHLSLKNSNFRAESIRVSLRFYQKSQLCSKN
jgi:hypothetical protein